MLQITKIGLLLTALGTLASCGGGSGGQPIPDTGNTNNQPPALTPDTAQIEEDETLALFDVLANDSDPDGDSLRLVDANTDTGTVTVSAQGLSYTPPQDFFGNATVSYTASDNNAEVTSTLTVEVVPVNDAPEAQDDSATVDRNSSDNVLQVLVNDTDVDDTELTLVSFDAPTGSASIEGQTLLYSPATDFSGTVTITYTVRDAANATSSASVEIQVVGEAGSNQPPTVVNDTVSIQEDVLITGIDVLTNDSDPDGDPLTIINVSASIGNASIAEPETLLPNTINYTPPENFFGEAQVSYTISDGEFEVSGTLLIEVEAVNDLPTARNDQVSVKEASVDNVINVLDNDTDVEDTALTITEVTAASGEATIDGEHILYTPSLAAPETTTLAYTIADSAGGTSSAQVSINITQADNRPPVVANESTQINEDTSLEDFDVLANDSDPDPDSISVINATAPVGVVTLTGPSPAEMNFITYTPPQDFAGEVFVTYTVSDGEFEVEGTLTIDVQAVNDPPSAANDDAFVETGSANNIINVLSNDQDVDGDDLTITSVRSDQGTSSIDGDNIIYTPPADFAGVDTIYYSIEDTSQATSEAEVAVTVGEVLPDPLNTSLAGRTIVVSQRTRAPGVREDPRDFNDWVRYDSPSNVDAPLISADGRSVTFNRTTADDGSEARDYLEFRFGPRYAGTRLSISMEVSAYNEASTGSYGNSLHAPDDNLSGHLTRQATSAGTWATVLDVDANSNETLVRVGLGVTEADTRVNSITLSNVQVSHLAADDNMPNEYVDSNGWLSAPGHNGASLPYAKEGEYNADTGLVSFSGISVSDTPSPAHVMMVTDSFGNFFSGYTRELFFGGIEGLPPRYTMTIDTQAGRQLEDETNGVLLQEMHDIRGHQHASPPGVLAVHLGVNTFMLDDGTTADLAEAALQAYLNFAETNDMVAVITTATPFKNSTEWTQAKQDEMDTYNARVLAKDNGTSIRVIDLNSLLDTNDDDIIEEEFLTSNRDYVHVSGPANAVLYNAYDEVFLDIIRDSNSTPPSTAVTAHINPSRTQCASPCTVVFSADKTQAEELDEHGIWSRLIYYFDFDTDETDTHGDLYDQSYTYVDGDTSHEIGGPMATKTFFCDTGICTYNVGMRAQNAAGEFDDAFVTITVEAESSEWAAAQTVCISNTLDTAQDWTTFDKACPDGASKRNTMIDAEDYGNTLVLLRNGDVFDQNIAALMGQSNFKIGYFGDNGEARPYINGKIWLGAASYVGDSHSPTATTSAVNDANVSALGWSENITLEGLKIKELFFPMSYQHIGVHDLDMDMESEASGGTIAMARNNVYCTDNPDRLSCANVPYPKGAYLSKVKVVGSQGVINNSTVLNVAAIGCAMGNFTGITDSYFRRAGEHNIRYMGWWRMNIMRSAWLGEHYSEGKQKLTIRSCLDGDIDRGGWLETELPPNWRRDPEGRTRADQLLDNGTDDYIHLSRYLVIQGNIVGENIQRGPEPGSTKIQTNVLEDDEPVVEDLLFTKNTFVNEGDIVTFDIGGNGWYSSCIDNTYSEGSAGCTPLTPDPSWNMIQNPEPLTPPLPPGS